MVIVNTRFSNGTFELTAKVSDFYAASGVTIQGCDVYEFDASSQGVSADPYVYIDDYELISSNNSSQIVLRIWFPQNDNRLLKWIVRVSGTIVTQSGTQSLDVPCCATTDENGNIIFEGYAVDLTKFKKDTLNSVKLKCNDCEVPSDLLNRLLKIFTVEAAVESKSPYMEMIFSKLACTNTKYPYLVKTFSRKCNCNG